MGVVFYPQDKQVSYIYLLGISAYLVNSVKNRKNQRQQPFISGAFTVVGFSSPNWGF